MGLDDNCADYIAKAATFAPAAPAAALEAKAATNENDLKDAIFTGRRETAAEMAAALLKTREPLDLIEHEIVPALDRVGVGFETGTVYLPQLLMSAEAAGAAFEEVRRVMRAAGAAATKCRVVLATVRGDIHDIGKNIVHLLLENYGFRVIDLGRDVPPETVLETARREGAPLVGLSALMTTTLPAMAETVALLHRELPGCRVMVGGAVLTAAYAEKIGADSYGKDAMEAVRYAESVFSQLKVHN
jgi:5-methyltetrahydrofolate--homocysteine methyltransferase